MSEYIVSARKYRPQTFDTVVGQEHITTTLKNAIRHQHLAHAYLFCGPRGVGKTTCARILAKTINCENPTPDMEACGVCSTCQSFKNNTSFNVFELDAASNNSVDDIRTLIDQVRFAPQAGKYKIYIIDEVHMLSAAAFNAFLKTLEEPPPYAIFILATTEKHKILPTILSRCQIFDFKRITTHDITAHLHSIATKEGVVAQEAALHVIAQKSEGCMRDALSMFDRIVSFTNGMLTYSNTMEHLNLLDADYYFKITDSMLSQDVSNTLLLLDQVLEKGFEGDVIIGGLAEHMRNLLLCKDPRMAKLLDVPNDHKPMYHEKAAQAPPSFIISALNVLNDSELQYKNATNKRLHVEMCLIKLCYVLQATKINGMQTAGNGESEIKKNTNSVATAAISNNTPQNIALDQPAKAEQPTNYQQPQPEPAKVREPEPIKQAAAMPQPVPAAPSQRPQGANTTGTNRRIGKHLLNDLDTAQVAQQVVEIKELEQEGANAIFEQYKQKVQAENKSMLYAQLSLMKLEVYPPDEIRIISPSDLTDTYAREQRNLLIDFFRANMGIMVRVTTEVREDASIAAQQNQTVLSKAEVFEVMARKNPNLIKLKEGLNLQIDY
ncbi:MAG TPA: DNA polymerase III subunit gamma/tau [Flavipsychrobacter sp.]|nr:DNA polymerase III subunit gamma/tau [Flavipsychrobacter sp.]